VEGNGYRPVSWVVGFDIKQSAEDTGLWTSQEQVFQSDICCEYYYCIVYELQALPDWKMAHAVAGAHLKQRPSMGSKQSCSGLRSITPSYALTETNSKHCEGAGDSRASAGYMPMVLT
jgi:hypothetical protein